MTASILLHVFFNKLSPACCVTYLADNRLLLYQFITRDTHLTRLRQSLAARVVVPTALPRLKTPTQIQAVDWSQGPWSPTTSMTPTEAASGSAEEFHASSTDQRAAAVQMAALSLEPVDRHDN